MGCCQSLNWKKIKEQITKNLNLDAAIEDNNIKNDKENTVEISNITKTLDNSEQDNKKENSVINVELSDEDFELI